MSAVRLPEYRWSNSHLVMTLPPREGGKSKWRKEEKSMPIYEYQCRDCGDEFEKMIRLSEADQKQICPTCRSQNTKKKISFFSSLGSLLGGSSFSTDSSCGSSGGFT
jgi:putative FmdB family regulatory protein